MKSTILFHHPVAGAVHGSGSGPIFRPLVWLADGANLKRLQAYAKRRFLRDQGAAFFRLPRRIRRGAVDQAVQSVVDVFIGTDYERAGLTEDQAGLAFLRAVAYRRRALWSVGDGLGCRKAFRAKLPSALSMSAMGDNPAQIVSAAEGVPDGVVAIVGEGREVVARDDHACEVAIVEGGDAYLDSLPKMVATTARFAWQPGEGSQDWPTDGGLLERKPYKYRQRRLPGGWKMATRRSHHATVFPPCVVQDVADYDDAPRYTGHYVAPPRLSTEGLIDNRPAPSPEWQEVAPGHHVRLAD